LRPLTGALGQVSLGSGPKAPGNAADQTGAVAFGGGLAEQFGEALAQFVVSEAVTSRPR
jgi:hypothetical protein